MKAIELEAMNPEQLMDLEEYMSDSERELFRQAESRGFACNKPQFSAQELVPALAHLAQARKALKANQYQLSAAGEIVCVGCGSIFEEDECLSTCLIGVSLKGF
jgi:hypothetical protein